MNDHATLTALLGWCTVINLGFLMLVAIGLMSMRSWLMRLHSKMFNVREDELPRYYFQYLANYKLLVIVFNLVPYIALKIVS
jgi:Zn-dependent protease